MENAAELLRMNENAEGALNTILSVFSYTLAKPLNDKGICPKCGELFPSDLWEWYSQLYCPYCGQRVQAPEDADNVTADSVVYD